jgi:hypothetical protein
VNLLQIKKERIFMPIVNRIAGMKEEITEWRRDFHEHPELLYDVHRTAGVVAEKLKAFGCDEVVPGVGRTGVVGIIKGRKGGSGKVVGMRADMDAGSDRIAICVEDPRQDARLRTRWSYRNAARRREVSVRNT